MNTLAGEDLLYQHCMFFLIGVRMRKRGNMATDAKRGAMPTAAGTMRRTTNGTLTRDHFIT